MILYFLEAKQQLAREIMLKQKFSNLPVSVALLHSGKESYKLIVVMTLWASSEHFSDRQAASCFSAAKRLCQDLLIKADQTAGSFSAQGSSTPLLKFSYHDLPILMAGETRS